MQHSAVDKSGHTVPGAYEYNGVKGGGGGGGGRDDVIVMIVGLDPSKRANIVRAYSTDKREMK